MFESKLSGVEQNTELRNDLVRSIALSTGESLSVSLADLDGLIVEEGLPVSAVID
jgi:hypothetical protein